MLAITPNLILVPVDRLLLVMLTYVLSSYSSVSNRQLSCIVYIYSLVSNQQSLLLLYYNATRSQFDSFVESYCARAVEFSAVKRTADGTLRTPGEIAYSVI